jgi:anti-anti-sigma factor
MAPLFPPCPRGLVADLAEDAMQDGYTPMEVWVAVAADRRSATIKVSGEVDVASAAELREAIHGEIRAGRDLTVDLGTVSLLDASGVSVLIAGLRTAEASGQTFRVVNAGEGLVGRVLRITKAARVLQID